MRSVAWVVLVAKDGHKAVDSRVASAGGKDVRKAVGSRAALAEKGGHREVLTQVPASRLEVAALVVKVAGRKAAGRRVAKAARKAVAFRVVFLPGAFQVVFLPVAFRVVLLPLAFQVKASHNPDKDSTW